MFPADSLSKETLVREVTYARYHAKRLMLDLRVPGKSANNS